MNQRDLSEIKRRLNPDHRDPTLLRGCYIGGDGQIISRFSKPIGMLSQEENEKYMALFKKTLSGAMGQNLLSIDFPDEQLQGGAEHQLLCQLCESALKDEDAVERFYQSAAVCVQAWHNEQAQSVDEAQNTCNYLVLLLHDGYDVPFRDGNGEIDRERSTDVYNAILCCVCPVKRSKPVLTYFAAEGEFHSRASDWVVSAPEMGFLFPAFEERSANMGRALYYTRTPDDLHDAFIRQVFNAPVQMTASEQKETFQAILQETLADECRLDVVQTVHETIRGMLEEQKADKTAEPLALGKRDVKRVLEESGVSSAKAEAFEEKYEESFGEQAEVPAINMVTPKRFKVDTPSVSIQVAPENSNLIETRMIDGRYYILVLADGDVEVNGMKITC